MTHPIKTRPFDAAEFLDSDEMIAVFLADAYQSGKARVFQEALQIAARARGMAGIAEASGLGRESLYKALRPDAQPRFETVRRVVEALGVTLSFSATHATKATRSLREPPASYDLQASETARKSSPSASKKPAKKAGAGGVAASSSAKAVKVATKKATTRKPRTRRATKPAAR